MHFRIHLPFYAYSEIHTEMQGTQNSQKILKKNKFGELIVPGFKMYYKTTVVKIA